MAADDSCIPTKDRERKSYENDDCHGWHKKTRAVTGPKSPSAAMSVNFVVESLLSGITWDNVTKTQPSDTVEQLEFFNGASSAKIISIECTSSTSWRVVEGAIVTSFLLLESGDYLLQEDNTSKIILES